LKFSKKVLRGFHYISDMSCILCSVTHWSHSTNELTLGSLHSIAAIWCLITIYPATHALPNPWRVAI